MLVCNTGCTQCASHCYMRHVGAVQAKKSKAKAVARSPTHPVVSSTDREQLAQRRAAPEVRVAAHKEAPVSSPAAADSPQPRPATRQAKRAAQPAEPEAQAASKAHARSKAVQKPDKAKKRGPLAMEADAPLPAVVKAESKKPPAVTSTAQQDAALDEVALPADGNEGMHYCDCVPYFSSLHRIWHKGACKLAWPCAALHSQVKIHPVKTHQVKRMCTGLEDEAGGSGGNTQQAAAQRQKRTPEEEAERQLRTVFVGNLPVTVRAKALKQCFSQCAFWSCRDTDSHCPLWLPEPL